MDALTLLNVALAGVNLAVAVFQGWKEWRTRRTPTRHPLDDRLRDITIAIQGLKGTRA